MKSLYAALVGRKDEPEELPSQENEQDFELFKTECQEDQTNNQTNDQTNHHC